MFITCNCKNQDNSMKKITGFVTKVFYVENTVNKNDYNNKISL